ncbi:MAG: nickel pincer cofactor biosynthesis protein LarC [Chloroflexi bacterium]|nr:nickel pincer cofactor biosynthesis protein LarC [Chloroflexota bacterium]
MKTAYFDCFSGISGNMILGALVDLGLDLDQLRSKLAVLPLGDHSISAARVLRHGIAATYIDVVTPDDAGGRTLDEIIRTVRQSELDPWVTAGACRIFTRLAEAEASVHGHDGDATRHLHEVGATDTIIDVVGGLVGLQMLGVEAISSSPVNLGSGMVQCSHGWLPVPAPATAELIKGMPVYSSEIRGELTTPTGAAMISGLAVAFGPMPTMAVEGVGYGAGRMELDVPNVLRVFLGRALHDAGQGHATTEPVVVLETNIDDMNPQLYDHVMDSLLKAGALDAFLTPVQMKKNRPGTLLTAVARREDAQSLADLLFSETTTLGVRMAEVRRRTLPRFERRVTTRFGRIRVKVAERGGEAISMAPEYNDCSRAARRSGVPVSEIYAEVRRAWERRGSR